MSDRETRLADLATVVRSKNAGPFELTLDVFFVDADTFRRVRDAGAITPDSVAALYGIDSSEVLEVTFFEPAAALKVTLKRRVSSGSPGDNDVFGAQQHVPLMQMRVKLR
jgi:hypothetical protein